MRTSTSCGADSEAGPWPVFRSSRKKPAFRRAPDIPTTAPARVLRLIAAFKFVKGLLLVVLGVATISLRHRDVTEILGTWVDQLHLDPGGRLVHGLLVHTADLHARRLVAIGAGMLFYAALLLTEGFGLLLRRRWGEYLTVVATSIFIPLELYEIARHHTWTRLAVLVVNIVIVWYLLIRLRERSEA